MLTFPSLAQVEWYPMLTFYLMLRQLACSRSKWSSMLDEHTSVSFVSFESSWADS
jgi:hypothetical protein